MHILMADDDKDDYVFLQEAVEKAEASVSLSYAANWLDLWRYLMKSKPDAIFLDINMPVKNGLECLQLIRDHENYNDIPVIMYTTSLSKVDIDQAYLYGANLYIVKPNTLDEIAIILKKVTSMTKEHLLGVPPREEFVMI